MRKRFSRLLTLAMAAVLSACLFGCSAAADAKKEAAWEATKARLDEEENEKERQDKEMAAKAAEVILKSNVEEAAKRENPEISSIKNLSVGTREEEEDGFTHIKGTYSAYDAYGEILERGKFEAVVETDSGIVQSVRTE